MEQFWQFLVITDLKATERSKNTHSSQNMSDLGKCRVAFRYMHFLKNICSSLQGTIIQTEI